jgi:hypothetical protein
MSGTIDVLRDNEFQSMVQQNLVPNDVVALKPGITYRDMVYEIKSVFTSYRVCLVQSTYFTTMNSNPQSSKILFLATSFALKPRINYYDMILLQGSRLVVDENALTGE